MSLASVKNMNFFSLQPLEILSSICDRYNTTLFRINTWRKKQWAETSSHENYFRFDFWQKSLRTGSLVPVRHGRQKKSEDWNWIWYVKTFQNMGWLSVCSVFLQYNSNLLNFEVREPGAAVVEWLLVKLLVSTSTSTTSVIAFNLLKITSLGGLRTLDKFCKEKILKG